MASPQWAGLGQVVGKFQATALRRRGAHGSNLDWDQVEFIPFPGKIFSSFLQ
jgi:hypothetical protein